MNACQVEGCTRSVSKPGHELCHPHWKAEQDGHVRRCAQCRRWHEAAGRLCRACSTAEGNDEDDASADHDSPAGVLSSTKLGRHFGLSNVRVNLLLAEMGWVERYGKGWSPTDRGNALGANVKAGKKALYVVWPASILTNAAVMAGAVSSSLGKERAFT